MSEGWKCPVCGRGVAPSEKTCEHGDSGSRTLPSGDRYRWRGDTGAPVTIPYFTVSSHDFYDPRWPELPSRPWEA